jgi:Protein of unknown function (DUF2934)
MDKKERAARRKWISEAAYYLAEARGFTPGKALDDWLKAEKKHAEMTISYYLSVIKEDEGMITIANLRRLAEALGIEDVESMYSEKKLVRAIQRVSQHLTCFRSDRFQSCGESDCPWKNECRKLIAVWIR